MLDRFRREEEGLSGYDPRANDIASLKKTLDQLAAGEPATYHPYNHSTGVHDDQHESISSVDVLIVDGIHSLHPALLPLVDYKVFLYSPAEESKELRFLADLFDRGYTARSAFQHAEDEYQSFEEHILQYAKFADDIIELNNYWDLRISGGISLGEA